METNTQIHKLTIKVENIPNAKGDVAIAIYGSKEEFLVDGKELDGGFFKAQKGSVECTFELPEQEYAVAAYHDFDEAKKLTKNLLGAPIKPYGFSMNPKVRFRAPYFKECALDLNKDLTSSIKLK